MPQGGKQFVFLLDEQGQGDAKKLLSRRVEVEPGVRRGSVVQIVNGVASGDTVVVAGQQRLQRDGTAVRVVNMVSTTEGAAQARQPVTP
ncbi:hypothetical protein FQZ97_1178990 [compost metagenome]